MSSELDIQMAVLDERTAAADAWPHIPVPDDLVGTGFGYEET